MSARDVIAPSASQYGAGDPLRSARLAYIERHGARFLFNNAPPPAPGWPRLRKGKVVS